MLIVFLYLKAGMTPMKPQRIGIMKRSLPRVVIIPGQFLFFEVSSENSPIKLMMIIAIVKIGMKTLITHLTKTGMVSPVLFSRRTLSLSIPKNHPKNKSSMSKQYRSETPQAKVSKSPKV